MGRRWVVSLIMVSEALLNSVEEGHGDILYF